MCRRSHAYGNCNRGTAGNTNINIYSIQFNSIKRKMNKQQTNNEINKNHQNAKILQSMLRNLRNINYNCKNRIKKRQEKTKRSSFQRKTDEWTNDPMFNSSSCTPTILLSSNYCIIYLKHKISVSIDIYECDKCKLIELEYVFYQSVIDRTFHGVCCSLFTCTTRFSILITMISSAHVCLCITLKLHLHLYAICCVC